MNDAANTALAAPKPAPETPGSGCTPDVDPTSAARHAGAAGRQAGNHGRRINRTLKIEMRSTRALVFGEDVAGTVGGAAAREGQGRRLQADARAPADVWRRSRVQLAAGRGRASSARDRDGARAWPVVEIQFSTHLAGDDADPRRAHMMRHRSGTTPCPGDRAGSALPAAADCITPVARASSRTARDSHRVSVERDRRGRPAADRHPLRRPRDALEQASLPPDLQKGEYPGKSS